MIASIRTGIVFLYVNRTMANCSDGSPVELAEVDHQIGCHVANAVVKFFGLEHERVQRPAFVIRDSLQAHLHFILKSFIFRDWNHSLRLAAMHVEKYSRV